MSKLDRGLPNTDWSTTLKKVEELPVELKNQKGQVITSEEAPMNYNEVHRPSVYEKLQNVRNDISTMPIKKGGFNKFSNYSYFELPDFLPEAQQLFNKYRITPVFNPCTEEATLIIYDWDSAATITFRTENADATVMKKDGVTPANLEIQTLGSTHTYLKRYLYMNALELAENDAIEVNTGNPEYKPKAPKIGRAHV